MRLESLYRVEFTTQEHWSVELRGEHGVESQSFLIVEGRCQGRIAARFRASNFPRRRTDGTVTPDFRGVLETDDDAVILFTWHGYGLTTERGERRLVGTITHLTGNDRYRWLNDVIGVLCGEIQARDDGRLDVALAVAELVWERP